ncbi:hypothetical protein [Lysobacter gummosus]|uniref:hypothetical protein n=1 Tax=Lysobacter gummosus TaxID=262324 RepID=UPI003643D391
MWEAPLGGRAFQIRRFRLRSHRSFTAAPASDAIPPPALPLHERTPQTPRAPRP